MYVEEIKKALRSTSIGLLFGGLAFCLTFALPRSVRSPYLVAYPLVIVSAWGWGVPAAISCAVAAGILIIGLLVLIVVEAPARRARRDVETDLMRRLELDHEDVLAP